VDERALFDLTHDLWRLDPSRVNFETSLGMLAWEGPTSGRTTVVERGDGTVVGWARLTPSYERIRRMGEWDTAPASLVGMVDWRAGDAGDVLESLVRWAAAEAGGPLTTSHTDTDTAAAELLAGLGFEPAADEPFGVMLQQPLEALPPGQEAPEGYVFTTMADLADVELRAAAHRVAWEGSTRDADDVRRTMAQWPYRADLDVVLLTDGGEPVGSALAWFDEVYEYGELEPVGISPDHRGGGLAAAMVRWSLARLRDAGASHAVVGARGDDDYPVPRKVYASVGFEIVMTQRIVAARA
jgi:predicted N-acetyltransferase YhbS